MYAFKLPIGGTKTPYDRISRFSKYTELSPLIKINIMTKVINPNAAGIDISSKEHLSISEYTVQPNPE